MRTRHRNSATLRGQDASTHTDLCRPLICSSQEQAGKDVGVSLAAPIQRTGPREHTGPGGPSPTPKDMLTAQGGHPCQHPPPPQNAPYPMPTKTRYGLCTCQPPCYHPPSFLQPSNQNDLGKKCHGFHLPLHSAEIPCPLPKAARVPGRRTQCNSIQGRYRQSSCSCWQARL